MVLLARQRWRGSVLLLVLRALLRGRLGPRLRLRLRARLFEVRLRLRLRTRLFEVGLRLRLRARLFEVRLRLWLRLRTRLFEVRLRLRLRTRLLEARLRLRLWTRLRAGRGWFVHLWSRLPLLRSLQLRLRHGLRLAMLDRLTAFRSRADLARDRSRLVRLHMLLGNRRVRLGPSRRRSRAGLPAVLRCSAGRCRCRWRTGHAVIRLRTLHCGLHVRRTLRLVDTGAMLHRLSGARSSSRFRAGLSRGLGRCGEMLAAVCRSSGAVHWCDDG